MNNKFNIIAVPRKEYLSKSIENLFLKKSVFDSIFFNSEKKNQFIDLQISYQQFVRKKEYKVFKKKKRNLFKTNLTDTKYFT